MTIPGQNNPGRGFYEIHTFVLGEIWDLANLCWCVKKEHTLALVLLDIKAARDRELSDTELAAVEELLQAFCNLNLEMILRVVYDRDGRGLENEPGQLARVKTHALQLSPLFQKYESNILVLQGLMLGNWGEMHGSKFLGAAAMKELANIWLSNTSLPLAVRTPAQHRILACCGCPERICLYNDGLFGSDTDLNTYADIVADLSYLEKACTCLPNGGEVLLPENDVGLLSSDVIIDRMKRLKITYLNSAHDVRMLEHMKTLQYQGWNLYEYIDAHLGYRFEIKQIKSKRMGGEISVEISLVNTGFAAMVRELEVYLILKADKEEKAGAELEILLSRVSPVFLPGETNVFKTRIEAPAGVMGYLSLRRKQDGREIQMWNQGQMEGPARLGILGKARLLLSWIL